MYLRRYIQLIACLRSKRFAFIYWMGNYRFLIFSVEREGKGLGVGHSIHYQIPEFLFDFEEVYMCYYFPTKQEVCVYLLNNKLWIFSIFAKGTGKGWHADQSFLNQIQWLFFVITPEPSLTIGNKIRGLKLHLMMEKGEISQSGASFGRLRWYLPSLLLEYKLSSISST